jgi:hypothetical protein
MRKPAPASEPEKKRKPSMLSETLKKTTGDEK